MDNNFRSSLAVLLQHEGGKANNSADPGGRTAYGVTQKTYNAYRDDHERPRGDVFDIAPEEVADIYELMYWDKMSCDDLLAGIDLSVFDMGVNSGPASGVMILQELLEVSVDGITGPDTLAAAEAYKSQPRLCNDYAEARLSYYSGLNTFGVFGEGWTRRVAETLDVSCAMAGDLSRLETLGMGSYGTQVAYLQSLLEMYADGIFGSRTDNVVRVFQSREELSIDGYVGQTTWRALLA